MAIYAPVSPFFRHFVSFVCLLVCDQKDLLPLICDQKDLLPLICDQKDLLPLSHALLLLCVFSLSLHFPRIVSREKETSMLNCCFRGARVSKTDEGDQQGIATDLVSDTLQANRPVDFQKETSKNENQGISSGSSSKHVGRIFQLSELAAATMNFKNDHCLGEGAFGNVYKGRLESTDQVLDLQIFETGEHALASSPKFSSHFFLHCQKIVIQALQNFKNRDTFPEMIDPKLEGQYPTRDLYCALDIAQMYLHKRPSSRPMIAEVVAALSYLASKMYRPKSQPNLKALSMNEPTVVVVTQALSSTKSNTCKEKEE